MVKVYGPLFSLDASGTLAKAVTFSKWKGRPYVRQRVIPSNPKSGPQTGMRAMLKFLSQQWTNLDSTEKADWLTRATATTISNFNAYVSYDQTRWRNYLNPSKLDPAAETGTAPDVPTTTPTGGIRQISLSIVDGVNAPDWGYAIHRSTTTGFEPAYSNVIAIVEWNSGGTTLYVDTPLLPATYYYRVYGFLDTGLKGAVETEVNGTAT
ncbi:hypothetical protein LCGC14_1914640 [marine sediment metagenome]|uniref:Uncharacterized protein n=1 Tax=marine sediment metagenome TaxID=412755 RepID=A0A0F9FSF3_9ZZZZ